MPWLQAPEHISGKGSSEEPLRPKALLLQPGNLITCSEHPRLWDQALPRDPPRESQPDRKVPLPTPVSPTFKALNSSTVGSGMHLGPLCYCEGAGD